MVRVLFGIILLGCLGIYSCVDKKPEATTGKDEFSHLKGYYTDSVYDTITEQYIKRRLVLFGAGRAYILDNGANEGDINDSVVDWHVKINNLIASQVPLNRFIKMPKCDLYIGISLESGADTLAGEYRQKDSVFQGMFTDSTGVIRILEKHDSVWSLKFLIDDNKTYLFSFVSKDSAMLSKKYNDNENPKQNIIVSYR